MNSKPLSLSELQSLNRQTIINAKSLGELGTIEAIDNVGGKTIVRFKRGKDGYMFDLFYRAKEFYLVKEI